MIGDPVIIERRGAVAEVILNRPERKNALTGPMAALLRDAIRSLAGDDSVNAILLRGEGGAFCSGLDLKEFNADPRPEWLPAFQETWRGVHVALFNCPVPVVAALERYAINAGAALILGCDLVISAEDAYLQVGELQQGVSAPMNIAWLRAKHSEALAARIALTGQRIFAPELVGLGLALESIPSADVVIRAREFVSELASYPPSGPRSVKAGLRAMGPVNDPEEWFSRPASRTPRGERGPLPPVR